MKTTIIAIAGGSGSGKTTFARALRESLGDSRTSIIYQDAYYHDQSDKFDHDGGSVNFDHPSALDFDLMAEHLKILSLGDQVNVPIYDFATHSRRAATSDLKPKEILIVDGILILSQSKLRPLFDHSYYIDCPEELRFSRRLERDTRERGRTPEGVKQQFFNQVKPMHDAYVETSKQFADTIVDPQNFSKELNSLIKKLN